MDTAKPVCAGSNRSLPSMPEVGCLRRVEVVPRHLGQTKVDVGAADALRILLDIETATRRATRADAEGPSERSVQIPGAEHCSRSLLFAIRTIVGEFVEHSWSLSAYTLSFRRCESTA